MMRSRTGAIISGIVVALCVAVLSADQVIADRRAPADDKLIRDLQRQVQSDARLAPKLAAEKKRMTDLRLQRKSRDSVATWVLIAAAAVFLICAADTTPPLRRRPVRAAKPPPRVRAC